MSLTLNAFFAIKFRLVPWIRDFYQKSPHEHRSKTEAPHLVENLVCSPGPAKWFVVLVMRRDVGEVASRS